MSNRLEKRVAVVTGAGRGLGREHALFLASHGARVVVNDLGGAVDGGGGADRAPGQLVVEEIRAAGGQAVFSGHDVSSWEEAGEMIRLAIESFGDLHVLVNNAGILRDRTLANMTEAEWDAVVRVHLKGHAAPSHHAVKYWRQKAKSGQEVRASVVHTSSVAGLVGNFGQANYSAAKLGIVALSQVVATEVGHYGVRSNAISPSARTRLALTIPGSEEFLQPPENEQELDIYHPANVSPLVGWLAQEDCPVTRQIFHVIGNRILVVSMPQVVTTLQCAGRWTLEQLDEQIPAGVATQPTFEDFLVRLS